ncbi:MAG: hypothetical protein IKT57_08775 [Clostridia bacterium]|nr:hypothetical protein [Clostridia bacterium]
MRIHIQSSDFRFTFRMPTKLLFNAPVLWLYLKKNHQGKPYKQCANIVRELRAWGKQHTDMPLMEVQTDDTFINFLM